MFDRLRAANISLKDLNLHPVVYFSDAVQKSQKDWAPTTKEAFAMVLAVRHWHMYLAGRKFTLNSDHNPLVHMRKQKDPRGKFFLGGLPNSKSTNTRLTTSLE